jgi:hypothetical protein
LTKKRSNLNRRKVSFEEAKNFADKSGLKYFETSAKEFINVDEAFVHIADKIIEKIDNRIIDPKNEVS